MRGRIGLPGCVRRDGGAAGPGGCRGRLVRGSRPPRSKKAGGQAAVLLWGSPQPQAGQRLFPRIIAAAQPPGSGFGGPWCGCSLENTSCESAEWGNPAPLGASRVFISQHGALAPRAASHRARGSRRWSWWDPEPLPSPTAALNPAVSPPVMLRLPPLCF